MMDLRDEKVTAAAGGTDPFKPSTLDAASMDKISDSDSAEPNKPDQHMSDDQYPHGLKFVLLAGASIIAVFLIALDQVSDLSTATDIADNNTNANLI